MVPVYNPGMMKKKIPLHSLVMVVGPSGAGKSTLIKNHFEDFEVVSSDAIRQELTGDFRRQDLNYLVFKELDHRVRTKLEIGERVVVDATHLKRADRASTVAIGTQMGVPIYYIVVNRPLEEKLATQGWRGDVEGLVERHEELFRANEREILMGDNVATVIDTRKEQFEAVRKVPAVNFDQYVLEMGFQGVMAIGDVHGMRERFKSAVDWAIARNLYMVLLGDIIDYGPHSVDCVDTAYDILMRGRGAMIEGNHERKISRWLQQDRQFRLNGTPIKMRVSHGNQATIDLIQAMSHGERARFEGKFASLLKQARNHIVLGDILFTHGGAEPEMFNIFDHRLNKRLESIALYGETDGFREDGYPNRVYSWVDRIPEGKQVVVGHDIRSTLMPLIVKGTKGGTASFIDTGSGKGGHLTSADILHENGRWEIKNFAAH